MAHNERAIHDETGTLIGVVEHPEGSRHFFAHSTHVTSPIGRKFRRQWEAANWIHAMHDLARVPFVDVSTVSEYGLTQKLSNAIRCF